MIAPVSAPVAHLVDHLAYQPDPPSAEFGFRQGVCDRGGLEADGIKGRAVVRDRRPKRIAYDFELEAQVRTVRGWRPEGVLYHVRQDLFEGNVQSARDALGHAVLYGEAPHDFG